MAKKQKEEPKVSIEGKEYKVSDLTPEQVDMVNHVADLDNKLRSAQFNIVQLQGGRNFFMDMLNKDLDGDKPEENGKIEANQLMVEIFAEYGMIGLVGLLFAGQVVFLQKTLMSKLEEIEGITIKLIDRWNRSDEKAERRHEKFRDEMNDLTDDIAFLKGRINGGGSRGQSQTATPNY